MQGIQVWSLGWDDSLEKGMATYYRILAWRIPWIEEPGRLQSMGLPRVGHDWVTNTFTFTVGWIVQFCSVTQLCLTLCDPMNHSRPDLPLHHQLPQFTQTHVHWVGDAIQPSHPLLSPSPPAVNSCPASGSFQMSQLFTSGGQSIRVSASTSVLPMNTQDWFPLGWTGWISLLPKGLSRVFSDTTVQKHQFFGAQLSL